MQGERAAKRSVDVIVLGLGVMGSAALWSLAKRGLRVMGLDAHTPPHTAGSSHGVSRIIRQAYFEDPAYVPLLLEAYRGWEELERSAESQLLHKVGGLMIGPPEELLVKGSGAAARDYNLPHRRYQAAEIRSRFPAFEAAEGLEAIYEEQAGYVLVEESIRAFLSESRRLGAALHLGEEVLAWEPLAAGGVRVRTAQGSYEAGALILCAGPWSQELLGFELPLQVSRQSAFWIDPVGGYELYDPARAPVFAWQFNPSSIFYGFPALEGEGRGVKVAIHVPGEPCSPETIRREVHPEEVEVMRALLRDRIPSLAEGRLLRAETCLYTNTPDEHFVVDSHPDAQQVIVAAGFSGHGFKFAPVIGEVLADLAQGGETRHPIGLFSRRRFSA